MSTLPYDFVSIDTAKIKSHEPIWHDGSQVDKLGLLSGELHVTMTVKTPLLVGNTHYSAEQAEGAVTGADGLTQLPAMLGNFGRVKKTKNIIEPLFGPQQANGQPGPVLINPRAIKGMIRHSIGALTNAPMERVGERQYLFRPNVARKQFTGNYLHHAKLIMVPAVVLEVGDGDLKLQLLGNRADLALPKLIWTKPTDRANLESLFDVFETGQRTKKAIDRNVVQQQNKSVFRYGGHQTVGTQSFTLCSYRSGQDGRSLHAQRFNGANAALVPCEKHPWIVINDAWRGAIVSLHKTDRVMQQLKLTYEVLADTKVGHLKDHPSLKDKDEKKRISDAVKDEQHWHAHQLVFVEVAAAAFARPVITASDIVSLGHHFRYYWAYTDSVRQRANADGVRVDRSELTPTPTEVPTEKSDKPSALSGARSLFGYVRDKENPSTHLGKKEFTRLAGRIAPNFAVEVDSHKPIAERFMAGSLCTALPILGSPKPSAAEFYLDQATNFDFRYTDQQAAELVNDQHPSIIQTFGEWHNTGRDIQTSPRLRGRKFYPHAKCVAFPNYPDYAAPADDHVQSDQASLVRYVLKPGARLKVAIRFKDLRPAELALLVGVLEPVRIFRKIYRGPGEVSATLGYANKLGYGRSIGMGSVACNIDAVRTFGNDKFGSTNLALNAPAHERLLSGLMATLNEDHFSVIAASKWNVMMRFNEANLQTKAFFKHNDAIFNWHTAIRKKHALFRS